MNTYILDLLCCLWLSDSNAGLHFHRENHPCVDTSSLLRHQEQKQQEKLDFERQLDERQKEHTQLLFMNNSHKEDVLHSVKLVPLPFYKTRFNRKTYMKTLNKICRY